MENNRRVERERNIPFFTVDHEAISRIATKNIPETKDRTAGILREYSR
jgi:uncharacterized protein with HEPN domain